MEGGIEDEGWRVIGVEGGMEDEMEGGVESGMDLRLGEAAVNNCIMYRHTKCRHEILTYIYMYVTAP